MKRLVVTTAALAVLAVPMSAPVANAHRNGCHPDKSCPSDRATYKWRGVLCVKKANRTATYKVRVRHGGIVYYCKSKPR